MLLELPRARLDQALRQTDARLIWDNFQVQERCDRTLQPFYLKPSSPEQATCSFGVHCSEGRQR